MIVDVRVLATVVITIAIAIAIAGAGAGAGVFTAGVQVVAKPIWYAFELTLVRLTRV